MDHNKLQYSSDYYACVLMHYYGCTFRSQLATRKKISDGNDIKIRTIVENVQPPLSGPCDFESKLKQ